MVNFWENEKNISPPYDLWEKMWGKMWGKMDLYCGGKLGEKWILIGEGMDENFWPTQHSSLWYLNVKVPPYQCLYILETMHYIYIVIDAKLLYLSFLTRGIHSLSLICIVF